MLKKKIRDYLHKLSIEGASDRVKPPCNVYISETLDYISIDKNTGYPYCIPVKERISYRDLCDYVTEQLEKLTKSSKYLYRGIQFSRSEIGSWVFDDCLPSSAIRWGYWNRFFTSEEAYILQNCTIEEGKEVMKRAIDRAYNNDPVYTGDIRYRDWDRKRA